MSNATAYTTPRRLASWETAATPAAGPDITVERGKLHTASVGSMPPVDCTTNRWACGRTCPIASARRPMYARAPFCTAALSAVAEARPYSRASALTS